MTLQELARLVSLGEGPRIEFKRRVPRPERIAKEMIAFANTDGGHVLLGVDDDGTIRGVRDVEEEEFVLRRALQTHCEPALAFETVRVEVTAKRNAILVHVPESDQKPHYLVGNGSPGRTAYVRVEDKSVEASPEAVRLMRDALQPRDVTFRFGEKELLLMRYLERYGRITVEQFASLANIPRRRASHTLVLLARASILQLHPDDRTDFFTLAYDTGG